MKTNNQMYLEVVQYFEPKAKASGFFDEDKIRGNLSKCYSSVNKPSITAKFKKICDMDNRTTVDLLNLLDYLSERITREITEIRKKPTGFMRDIMLDAIYDVFFDIVYNIIQEKEPENYKQLMAECA